MPGLVSTTFANEVLKVCIAFAMNYIKINRELHASFTQTPEISIEIGVA